jgi:hypothetical protein
VTYGFYTLVRVSHGSSDLLLIIYLFLSLVIRSQTWSSAELAVVAFYRRDRVNVAMWQILAGIGARCTDCTDSEALYALLSSCRDTDQYSLSTEIGVGIHVA